MTLIANLAPIIVKRYDRDRLYDTANLRYVTLEQLREWARAETAFRVIDAATGADITRQLLG